VPPKAFLAFAAHVLDAFRPSCDFLTVRLLDTGQLRRCCPAGVAASGTSKLRRRRPCHCLIFDVDPAAGSSKHSCAPRTYLGAPRAKARSSSNCRRCLRSAQWKSRRQGFAPQRRKGGEAGPIATRSWLIGRSSTTTDGYLWLVRCVGDHSESICSPPAGINGYWSIVIRLPNLTVGAAPDEISSHIPSRKNGRTIVAVFEVKGDSGLFWDGAARLMKKV